MRNLSARPGLILAILYVLVFGVAGCSRRGSSPNRGGDGDFDCDATCEADVRSHAVSAGRLQVNEAQWQAAFAAGKAELANDPQWLELIAEMNQLICPIIAHTADRQKVQDLEQRIGQRTTDDLLAPPNVGNATKAGDSPEVDAARAKVVKIHLIRYIFYRQRHSCPH